MLPLERGFFVVIELVFILFIGSYLIKNFGLRSIRLYRFGGPFFDGPSAVKKGNITQLQ